MVIDNLIMVMMMMMMLVKPRWDKVFVEHPPACAKPRAKPNCCFRGKNTAEMFSQQKLPASLCTPLSYIFFWDLHNITRHFVNLYDISHNISVVLWNKTTETYKCEGQKHWKLHVGGGLVVLALAIDMILVLVILGTLILMVMGVVAMVVVLIGTWRKV